MTRLTVYARPACDLCAELLAELSPWAADRGLEVEIRDVDADRALAQRYGLRVPVLTLDGEWVCSGLLDLVALERRLAAAG